MKHYDSNYAKRTPLIRNQGRTISAAITDFFLNLFGGNVRANVTQQAYQSYVKSIQDRVAEALTKNDKVRRLLDQTTENKKSALYSLLVNANPLGLNYRAMMEELNNRIPEAYQQSTSELDKLDKRLNNIHDQAYNRYQNMTQSVTDTNQNIWHHDHGGDKDDSQWNVYNINKREDMKEIDHINDVSDSIENIDTSTGKGYSFNKKNRSDGSIVDNINK